MRKRSMLFGLILALLVLALCACEQGGACNHEFESWKVTKEVSCGGPGLQSRQCHKCGFTETSEISGNVAHTEEVLPAVAATCTTDGLTEGKRCSVCQTVTVKQETLLATGHAEVVDAAVAATCTEAGLTEGKHCTRCQEVTVPQEEVPAAGHTEVVDAAVAATCTESGLTEGKHCSVCQAVIVKQETVEATGHTEVVDAAVAATCTETGLTEGKHCAVCNLVILAQETVATTGHNFNQTPVKAPTCNTEGSMQFACQTCGYSYTAAVTMPAFTATQIHDMAAAAVGEVITYDASGNALSLGSCFVYSSDGTIVTNYHVIEGAHSATVTINNVTYGVKQVLAYSPTYDLAVLKIDATGLAVLPVCTNTHAVGETVYAFGSSQGLTATFSQGIISHASRDVGGVLCVQHDAAISSGNSGGPLINRFGEIIGINTFYISDSQNLNFAVSVTELSKLDYSNPMTLEQMTKAERSAFQIMRDYIMTYGDFYAEDNEYSVIMESVFSDDGAEYITYYDYDLTYNELELNLTIDWEMQLTIYITEEDGVYGWKYVDVYDDYMYGYQDAAAYKEGALLSYEYYELNDLDTAEALCDWCTTLADLLCGWLNYDLEGMGLTAKDLGFIHY